MKIINFMMMVEKRIHTTKIYTRIYIIRNNFIPLGFILHGFTPLGLTSSLGFTPLRFIQQGFIPTGLIPLRFIPKGSKH